MLTTNHLDYDSMAPKWQRCRDAASGQDAVHAAGKRYLPELKKQQPDEYAAYKLRALFYNATWRTIAAMSGMLFRKAPIIEVPSIMGKHLDNITGDGDSFGVLSQKIAEDVLAVGRCGVLVDHPPVDQDATMLDYAAADFRPTMYFYKAEDIYNWHTDGHRITMVRLKEKQVIRMDEFDFEEAEQYRILDLDLGHYRQRIFRKIKGKEELQQIGDDIIPVINGKRLDYIPFQFFNVSSLTAKVEEPPLIDLVNVNMAHYRATADYEHGLHYCGLPTPFICGHSSDASEEMYIGGNAAWIFPNPDTKVGFLEFTGAGLEPLRQSLADKQTMMAILGARMLAEQKKAAETAEAAGIHRAGENATLAVIADTLTDGLKRCLEYYAAWLGSTEEIQYRINKDFLPSPMSAADITARMGLWQAGAISLEDLINELKKGEIIAEDRSAEDIMDDIAANPAALALDANESVLA